MINEEGTEMSCVGLGKKAGLPYLGFHFFSLPGADFLR